MRFAANLFLFSFFFFYSQPMLGRGGRAQGATGRLGGDLHLSEDIFGAPLTHPSGGGADFIPF